MQLATSFHEKEIVVSLKRQLSWTHLIALIPIEDPLKRMFYIEMCALEKWNVRTFRERINSMLYERTAISKKPEQNIINELELLKTEQQLLNKSKRTIIHLDLILHILSLICVF